MAKVKIQGHASGTGVLTVTAPNTSTDRTITLPDATGTLLNSDGSGASLTALNATQLTSGTLPIARIADDSITLAKMASGTDGNIISYDASGNPVAIATGTDGQVLTSTGAGSPPAFEDASGGGSSSASDLTSGTLPRARLPAGSVLQVITAMPNLGSHALSSGSWTEVSSSFRVSITPTYSDSKLIIESTFQFGGGSSSHLSHFKIYDVTNSADVELSASGSRTSGHGTARQVDHDYHDVDNMHLQVATTSGSTTARTYGMYHQNEGSHTTTKYFFTGNANVAAIGYAKPVFKITEVAQ